MLPRGRFSQLRIISDIWQSVQLQWDGLKAPASQQTPKFRVQTNSTSPVDGPGVFRAGPFEDEKRAIHVAAAERQPAAAWNIGFTFRRACIG